MQAVETFAPGWPGIAPRWTSSAKRGIGKAVSRDSRVWFTLSHGNLYGEHTDGGAFDGRGIGRALAAADW